MASGRVGPCAQGHERGLRGPVKLETPLAGGTGKTLHLCPLQYLRDTGTSGEETYAKAKYDRVPLREQTVYLQAPQEGNVTTLPPRDKA